MKIKKGGCIITTTQRKFEAYYKNMGYKIIEKKQNLEDMTVRELRKIASENSIESYTSLKKDDLIKAIEKVI